MEPPLPAPPEQLMTSEELGDALEDADIMDGKLPHFLNEQRRLKTDRQIAAAEDAAREERGRLASAKQDAGQSLTDEEFADQCYYLDPVSNRRRRRRPR